MQRLHPRAVWLLFFQYTFTWYLLYIIFTAFSFNLARESFIKTDSLFSLFLSVVLISLFSYLVARLKYHYWRYELADKSFNIERGIILKKYISIPYSRIQNIDIYRGLLARLFGLSVLQIQTAGYTGGMYGRARVGVKPEGTLFGLDFKTAKKIRDKLLKKMKDKQPGL